MNLSCVKKNCYKNVILDPVLDAGSLTQVL